MANEEGGQEKEWLVISSHNKAIKCASWAKRSFDVHREVDKYLESQDLDAMIEELHYRKQVEDEETRKAHMMKEIKKLNEQLGHRKENISFAKGEKIARAVFKLCDDGTYKRYFDKGWLKRFPPRPNHKAPRRTKGIQRPSYPPPKLDRSALSPRSAAIQLSSPETNRSEQEENTDLTAAKVKQQAMAEEIQKRGANLEKKEATLLPKNTPTEKHTPTATKETQPITEPKSPEIDAKRKTKEHLYKTLKGLVAGEMRYVAELALIRNEVMEPLQKQSIVDRKSRMDIFSTLDLLYIMHKQFLSKIDSPKRDQLLESLAPAFLHMCGFFSLYKTYCDNYSSSFWAVSTASEIPAFEAFWKSAHEKEALHEGHYGYLKKPLHRVLKYSIALKEVIKSIPEDHPAREELVAAKTKADKLTAYIKGSGMLSSNLQNILNIYKRFKTMGELHLVSPKRLFVREGTLFQVTKRGAQDRIFFLFSDVLLGSKIHKKGELTLKCKIPVDYILIRDRPDTKEQKNIFQIVRMDHKKIIYTLIAPSPKEKQKWIADLQKLIDLALVKFQKKQKIPKTLDESVDVAVTFLLWGVLPSTVESDKKIDKHPTSYARTKRTVQFLLPAEESSPGKILELNSGFHFGRESANDAVTLSKMLLQQIQNIYSAHRNIFEEFQEHGTCCVGLDPRYERFVHSTSELQTVSISELDDEHKLAFWLNTYHTALLHAFVELGYPPTPAQTDKADENFYKRLHFLDSCGYSIAGNSFSVVDMKWRILRQSMSEPQFMEEYLGRTRGKKKERILNEIGLKRKEALLNFALSDLVESSPAIYAYDSQDIYQQLLKTTREYLNKFVIVTDEKTPAEVPKLLEWFAADFGIEDHAKIFGVLSWCVKYVSANKKTVLMKHLGSKTLPIFTPFDWTFKLK